jgi:hypothetical protein
MGCWVRKTTTIKSILNSGCNTRKCENVQGYEHFLKPLHIIAENLYYLLDTTVIIAHLYQGCHLFWIPLYTCTLRSKNTVLQSFEKC